MPTSITTYPVTDGQPVTLDVTIGDGQAGGSSAYVGSTEAARGDRIEGVLLGSGDDLRGQTLVVSTTVVDVRPEHDHTSVAVLLKGGLPPEFPVVQAEGAIPGGSVNYLTVVRFV